MRVFGGIEDEPHSWPSAVRMRMLTVGQRVCGNIHCGACGGSIINQEWILTAAHCCLVGRTPRPANEITFAVGAHYDKTCDYSNRCNKYKGSYQHVTGDVVNATMVKVHPGYRPKSLAWDVCLVKVTPMVLDGFKMDRAFLPGNSCMSLK